MTRLGTSLDLARARRACTYAGCRIVADYEAGTLRAYDGNTVVLWAMQKGDHTGIWTINYNKHYWNDPLPA